MKDFSYLNTSTSVPPLVEKTNSFTTKTNSIDFYQQKERQLAPSIAKDTENFLDSIKSPNKDTDNQKVQTLRSEISRLREEMLVKINALENEMSNHLPNTEPRVTTINQSGSSKEQSTQTDSTNETSPSDFSFEQNIVRTIDRKLQNLRDEIFDKIDSVFATSVTPPANTASESRHKTHQPQHSSTHHLQPPTTRVEASWPPLRKLSRDHRPEPITTRPNSNHPPEPPQRYESTTRPNNEFSRQRPEPNTARSSADYQRMYDTYNRKSPIQHHYSNAQAPASRVVPTLINTASVRPPHPPTTIESSSPRSYYDTYSQAQSYQTAEQYSQTAREELARHLVDQLFQYDDLADANVRGVKGKRLLDPSKINKIRETVFRTYPVRSTENEEYLWKYICDKINAKCRGVTRTLKRKSAIWELENGAQLPPDQDYMKSHSMKTLSYEHHIPSATKYRKESFGDFERCSFVPPSGAANESRLSRHQSSSDSDTSSVECAPGVRPWKSAPERINAMTHAPIERPPSASTSCFSSTNAMKYTETITVEASSSSSRYERPDSSNSVKYENAESFASSTKTLGETDDIEVKVIDEDDDNGSDDVSNGHCADMDENSSFDRSNLILHDVPSNPQSVIELCDKLAEKYMENFHQDVGGMSGDVISDKKRIQSNREEFTRTLIEAMFTRSTLAHSNVTGARGKFMLDPVKIAKVKETVFRKFPAENEDEEETVWKILTTKINTKCRGVKRLMKRKGIPSDCIAKRYQGVLDDVNKQMVLGKEDVMYPPVYEGDSRSRDPYASLHSA